MSPFKSALVCVSMILFFVFILPWIIWGGYPRGLSWQIKQLRSRLEAHEHKPLEKTVIMVDGFNHEAHAKLQREVWDLEWEVTFLKWLYNEEKDVPLAVSGE